MNPGFHPLVWDWFSARFAAPTEAQRRGWQHIGRGEDTLIAAPTGSGKTLAAFLWSIDRLAQRAAAGALEDSTSTLYVSPLKALGNDIEKNLQQPLSGIAELAARRGIAFPAIRVAVRSGDTPAGERQLMVRRPPHVLITTPESLFILLTAARSREILRQVETVIVDEIHAVAADKRGSHLALSLERLEELAGRRLQRIGLSATQRPVEEIARLLAGGHAAGAGGACAVVDIGHKRELELAVELPEEELGPIARQEIWADIYEAIARRIREHRTTLVFVNTRRLVERVAHQLTQRLGEGKIGAHHGSLSRRSRLEVERRLKSGELSAVVATASLELGIDIGHVDLVCHIGAPRSLATLLQRVGRSGHALGALPKGIFYPLTRDDLVQCAAAIRAVQRGELDRVEIPRNALDILAQQLVASVAAEPAGLAVEKLWEMVRRAYPYRSLERRDFERVIEMLAEGVAPRRGRGSAHLHYDRVHGRVKARRGARLTAITNGGAIPDTADYDVVKLPEEAFVGKVNEDFAIESLAGDIFLLGNASWRIRRVAAGKVWVEDAAGLPPTIPFWLGEAPARTAELSRAVSELRREVERRLDEPGEARRWLMAESGVPEAGAEQIVSYVRETRAVLGAVPSEERVIAERFFDEAGGMQLVIHAPFGGRVNRAWGLALRKRFCVGFDRELQAAATDDGLVISLAEEHSFPIQEAFAFVRSSTLERDLTQALLASPMFTNRWRWNATRALALRRFEGGKRVPMALQRMRAEDLLAAVFPAQLMCQDNRVGPIELPDHPLVAQTVRDCLHEAMDLDGLLEILERIEAGEIRTLAVDTPAPSPMAHEILNANPYAFLDDAPLEERRARAVSLRRTDPELGRGIGALDPRAIEEVRRQARPEVRDADELHDLLHGVCLLPVREAEAWKPLWEELARSGRATLCRWRLDGAPREAYVCAERIPTAQAAVGKAEFEPEIRCPLEEAPTAAQAVRRIVQGWMELAGPMTAAGLAERLGLARGAVEEALVSLEAAGVLLRGSFTPEARGEVEWCERGLLARIHRLTIRQLRREIEPVTAADFVRFLIRWQRLDPETRLRGRQGVLEVVRQLQGLELPAPAWERYVLPARVENYDPADLEQLCLAGIVAWGRLRPGLPPEEEAFRGRRPRRPTRAAPIAFLLREELDRFLPSWRGEGEGAVSSSAREVLGCLRRRGASFLNEIARETGLLKTQVEEALWELVAHGLVTGDGIAALRVLLAPEAKRRPGRRLRLLSGGRAPERLMPLGRWSLWRREGAPAEGRDEREEFIARQLLRRYGVVLRELLAREVVSPRWRTLVSIYRRLEARGEIRGGHFVSGFFGEQFALPEAVEALRATRRTSAGPEVVIVSAADPLNLVGILTPGARVSPYSNQAIAYRRGVPVEVGALGAVRSRLQRS
jgi:ATP-dependent Lhr-like helicase